MTFVTALALSIAALVALPILAHRLRRVRATELRFAAAHLVASAKPRARRRSRLEDRALFGVRALAIVALALLGASPFVRCSRLSMQRSSGASVALAIVIDDSMSMRASASGATRFDRASGAARELMASLREGDAVAIVQAGAPCRVALSATTDLSAAREVLSQLRVSDRATDIDGALELSRGLLAQLPQVDKRVVLLSDLADGAPHSGPVGEGSGLPLWAPLEDIRGRVDDCALLSADRAGDRVRVSGACSAGATAAGREVTVALGEQVLARGIAGGSAAFEVSLTLPTAAGSDLVARLSGSDAIAADDVAPVLESQGPSSIAVIADSSDESVATGGAPVLEQALAALRVELPVRPLPGLPDRDEDWAPFIAVVLDDPAGLTPELRRGLQRFFDRGGVALVALGPRSARAPLGATLEPVLARAVTWERSPVTGVDAASGKVGLDESAASLVDLSAPSRAALAADDRAQFESLLAWKDGAPLFARRSLGRGEAWISTLPFAVDASDLVLRPAFLALIDVFVARARERASSRRSDVGSVWRFQGASSVSATGPAGAIAEARDRGAPVVKPALIGAYRVTVDGATELHVAAPALVELDTRPRALAPSAKASATGDTHADVDASPGIAVALLALLTIELLLRVLGAQREPRAGAAAAG